MCLTVNLQCKYFFYNGYDCIIQEYSNHEINSNKHLQAYRTIEGAKFTEALCADDTVLMGTNTNEFGLAFPKWCFTGTFTWLPSQTGVPLEPSPGCLEPSYRY